MHKISNIHFVGIGGVGMAGIAEVLLNLGYKISGSDLNANPSTKNLEQQGAMINYSHHKDNIKNCDVVVTSSAIAKDNIEIKTAITKHIPVIPRAIMLAELMRVKQGIAIAGTHGKTTTTSLIAWIFAFAKLDPTYVIGGKVLNINSQAKLGAGKYFIAEADESDASFLHLNPIINVITNIDNDHMETYNHNYQQLQDNFLEFIHKLPFYGHSFVCIDDDGVAQILEKIERPYTTYGFNNKADLQITSYKQQGSNSIFTIKNIIATKEISIKSNLPGKHNALNTLAAIAVAKEADIPIETIQEAIAEFPGIARRCQIKADYTGEYGSILLLDDYGHHPREIAAVLSAVKDGWPDKHICMVYQPHRFSRTKELFDDFSKVLSKPDALVLLNVFAAGEKTIKGATSLDLCNNIKKQSKLKPVLCNEPELKLWPLLKNKLKKNCIILMQGAGDIHKLTPLIANSLNDLA